MTTAQLTITALSGAAAGAILTGVVTLITTLVNRRHEHRRWLLEQRVETYVAFNQVVGRWAVAHTQQPAEASRLLLDLTAEGQRVKLVAPAATGKAVDDLISAAIDEGLKNTGKLTRKLYDLQVLDIQQEPRAGRLTAWAQQIATGAQRLRRRQD